MPGTPSTPPTKRELTLLLNTNTLDWETTRVRPGKWFAAAKLPRLVRSSSTNERQAMENLCRRLKLL